MFPVGEEPTEPDFFLNKLVLKQMCSRITFLLSWSKLPSSPSNRLKAERQKSICQGHTSFILGFRITLMLKSGT